MRITRFPHRLPISSKLLAAGAAVFLTVEFAPAPDGSIGPAMAFADKGGGGNGGGGNGGGSGGNSGGNGGGQAGSNRGTDAHGGAKEGVAKGADRYNDMAGRRAAIQERADDPASRHSPGREVAAFDDRQTRSLVARGWAARTLDATGVNTHGQRVSTLVAVARELGLSPSLGALQANFGTFGEIATRVAPSTYATYLGLRQQRQLIGYVSLFDVIDDGNSGCRMIFRIAGSISYGHNVILKNVSGRELHEVLTPEEASLTVRDFLLVIKTRRPVTATGASFPFRHGSHPWEAIALPLSSKGERVDALLTDLVSFPGRRVCRGDVRASHDEGGHGCLTPCP